MAHPLVSVYFGPSRDDTTDGSDERAYPVAQPQRTRALEAKDDTLIANLRRGDTTALTTLMQCESEQLVHIAEITTRSRDSARDVVQDVFIELWHNRKRLDPTRNLRAYLRRAVRHRALDMMRHTRAQTRIAHATVPNPTVENLGESAIDSEEFRAQVHMVLANLPPRCREIFLLHREAGLDYIEIEAMLGVSNATIRNQVSRATRALAQAVAAGLFRDWLA